MSGGSLNYAYSRIDDVASTIERNATTTLHRSFVAHLRRVSDALYAMEWMLSGDTSPGDEEKAIRACLPADAELMQALSDAWTARHALDEAIRRVAKSGD